MVDGQAPALHLALLAQHCAELHVVDVHFLEGDMLICVCALQV